jgi:quinohemoprotein ethanol dehydrogenase
MARILGGVTWAAGALALVAASSPSLIAASAGAAEAGRDWFSFGGDDSEQHYSPLAQITPANVSRLGLAWSYDIDTFDAYTQPLAAK